MPYTLIPDIADATIKYFNAGANFAAGDYVVSYVTGACDLNASGMDWAATRAFHVTDGAGNDVGFPSTTSYNSQAEAEAAEAGTTLTFHHLGGQIGMYLMDNPYSDNVAGSPNPTFSIPSPEAGIPVPTLTATPSLPGNVPTIFLQGY